MTSLNAQCDDTSAMIARSALDDRHWRVFGFKKRPRRGRLFLRFVAAPMLERETVLLRELMAADFANVFNWAIQCNDFAHRTSFLAKLLEYCVDGTGEPLWPVFRFPSRRDAIDFVSHACDAYRAAEREERMHIFLKRYAEALSQPVPKEWLVGTAWLFAHPESSLLYTAQALTQAGVADNPDCDIVIDDVAFLNVAKRLLREDG